jgi:hypothetical protein
MVFAPFGSPVRGDHSARQYAEITRLASTRRSLLLALALAFALHFRLEVLEIGAARLRFNHDGDDALPFKQNDAILKQASI